MLRVCLAALSIALVLLLSEFLWRKERIKNESARKFVHIIAGTIIAFFPFWVSYNWIMILGLGFVVGNLVNRYTPLFNAVHAVKRKTWGDVLFGIGVLICALFRPDPLIFTAAILHLALADGFAALVGERYGKHFYRVFDHKKSLIGSLAFAIMSFSILAIIVAAGHMNNSYALWPLLLGTPILTAALENLSGYGTDNITVPLTVLMLLNSLRF
jgi:phytol kinase